MDYDGYDRLKKVRAFALGVFGSFIFAFSSVVASVREQLNYLVLGALSVTALTLAFFAMKSASNTGRFFYLVSTGAVLAAEASAVMLYFLTVDALVYTMATLVGSLLAVKGIMDMDRTKVEDYYWKKKELERELTP